MDWREFLNSIISNPAERDRIANEIGVHAITLSRWASGESTPRPHNLRQLLRALPMQQRNQLQPLLVKESSDISQLEIDTTEQDIPYGFIMDVLEARSSIPDLLRFWSIT